ncbi:MAG TPA: nucleoside monophosphate kinase [Candidatus Woesebacteria bacterium]|jgi:adenylate kinase|nr:nucleoside monophosphate kinase [Candidatus Shapirobacteria bacterium]HOR01840.1 nucleoside monophosphate kinase [Candidatus Woesebacteria bacterium]
MSLNLFIIGPSGCGKSTQAKLIAEKYNLTHLSMGQILRDEMAAGTPEGLEAKSFVDSGTLVPEELTFKLLTGKLNQIGNKNFIIDGFPRSLGQGQFIEKYLTQVNEPLDLIIHLDVTFEEINARRAKMGAEFQDKDRTDNTPEAMASRQKFYDDNNGLIMDYFTPKGLVLQVDGNRPIEPIFKDIDQKVSTLK